MLYKIIEETKRKNSNFRADASRRYKKDECYSIHFHEDENRKSHIFGITYPLET